MCYTHAVFYVNSSIVVKGEVFEQTTPPKTQDTTIVNPIASELCTAQAGRLKVTGGGAQRATDPSPPLYPTVRAPVVTFPISTTV